MTNRKAIDEIVGRERAEPIVDPAVLKASHHADSLHSAAGSLAGSLHALSGSLSGSLAGSLVPGRRRVGGAGGLRVSDGAPIPADVFDPAKEAGQS